MDSKSVDKEIISIIRPILKENGFSKFSGRTYWRYYSDRIDILNFQSFNSYNANVIGCTTFSFSVNLSVYLTFVPEQTKLKEKNKEIRPNEAQGHFRSGLKKEIEQPEFSRKDIWFINSNGENISTTISDCKNQIQQIGLNWFKKFDTTGKIMKILIEDPIDMNETWGFGNFDSARRNELIAYVALKLGQIELAVEKLNMLIDFIHEQYKNMKYDYYVEQIKRIEKEIKKIKNTYSNTYNVLDK